MKPHSLLILVTMNLHMCLMLILGGFWHQGRALHAGIRRHRRQAPAHTRVHMQQRCFQTSCKLLIMSAPYCAFAHCTHARLWASTHAGHFVNRRSAREHEQQATSCSCREASERSGGRH
jgi:hypothetical protein